MSDFLKEIVEYKQSRLKDKKDYYAQFKKNTAKPKPESRGIFREAIVKSGQINLIAEIKKASPSQGVIRKDFDLFKIAKAYDQAGASAYSILTEDKYFLGEPDYIRQVSTNFSLPILTKDFIIDEAQIYEASAHGAHAVLLIVAILTDAKLKQLLEAASVVGLDALVEVHDEKELQRALAVRAQIIGVNNRDLRTLKVDMATAEKLIPMIPRGTIIVAESGIKTHQDVQKLKKLGAHAVLIGETFMGAPDIGSKVKEVMQGVQ